MPESNIPEPESIKSAGQNVEAIDASDWKVYRNEQYGIEFKYPSSEEGWKLDEYDYPEAYPGGRQKGVQVFFDYKKSENSNKRGEGIDVSFVESPYGSDYVKFLRTQIDTQKVFLFDFNGYEASADMAERRNVEAFFDNAECPRDVVFGIPSLSKAWNLGGLVSIECSANHVPKQRIATIRVIAGTIRFFGNAIK